MNVRGKVSWQLTSLKFTSNLGYFLVFVFPYSCQQLIQDWFAKRKQVLSEYEEDRKTPQ
jgi:hypothetical protein